MNFTYVVHISTTSGWYKFSSHSENDSERAEQRKLVLEVAEG